MQYSIYLGHMIPTKKPSNTRNFLKSDHALTEVLDFITIIGILILSFSLIGLAGYPALKNAQEAKQIENTIQSFTVLADSVNKVATGRAPSQNIELKLYGGKLRVAGESRIKVNATRFNFTSGSNQEITLVEYLEMGGIENSIGDTIIAYEGTGVWIKYPGDVIFNIYKPLINNQSNILIIPVVSINGKSAISGSGLSKVTVCQQEVPSEEGGCGMPYIYHFSNMSNITITITGNYTKGWQSYFENTIKWSPDTGGNHTGRLNATNMDVFILKSWIQTVIT